MSIFIFHEGLVAFDYLQVCSEPVVMQTVEGDHESFILGKSALKVADIINRSLSADVNGTV